MSDCSSCEPAHGWPAKATGAPQDLEPLRRRKEQVGEDLRQWESPRALSQRLERARFDKAYASRMARRDARRGR